MLETVYTFTQGKQKTIEKIIEDGNAAVNHMILPKDAALPEHYSNSNVYMIVIRGILSLRLNEQEEHRYAKGHIIVIPYRTKMNVYNVQDETAEIFVIKAPSPKVMGQK